MDLLANQFHSDGFVELPNCIDSAIIEKLFVVSNENYDEVQEIIKNKNLPFGIGAKCGFKEIVQRHTSRFEMPYKMNNSIVQEIADNVEIKQLVTNILGSDAKIINQSLVMCLPGAENQAWHSDGSHVSVDTHLPCHVLNVFVPLIDLTLELGPTEFRPGSHVYSRDLTRLLFLAAIKKTLRKNCTPIVQRGSVLLFDYRVLHRGTANQTSIRRPILAITFAKPWFKDIVNFPARSVFDAVDDDVEDK